MVDGVHDRRRLVHVAEHVVAAHGSDHQKLGVAAEARDPFPVRHGARRERGRERPVAVLVVHARDVVNDVPGLGVLRGNVGMGDIRAGVDEGDLEGTRRAQDGFGYLVLTGRDVLPFVGEAGAEHRGQRRLDLRRAQERAMGECDARKRGE